jgi:hypothetical protein
LAALSEKQYGKQYGKRQAHEDGESEDFHTCGNKDELKSSALQSLLYPARIL